MRRRGDVIPFRPIQRVSAAPEAGSGHWLVLYRRLWNQSLDRLEIHVAHLKELKWQPTTSRS